MQYPVKYFHSGMAGAPSLSNGWGDLDNLLNACLVTGFAMKAITLLTFDAETSTATATINAGHSFAIDQILEISGADQTAYNGQVKVKTITATTFTFEVEGTPTSPATTQTTISVKVAPLGFERVFSGTNKSVYRSPNPESSRAFLRVDNSRDPLYTDTYAKYAKVTVAENMSDIDTFIGARAPYDPLLPIKNEVATGVGANVINGWFKWYHARGTNDTTDGGAFLRNWVLVGCDRGFYFLTNTGVGGYAPRNFYSFGDIESFKQGDAFSALLLAADDYTTATSTSTYAAADNSPAVAGDTKGKIMMRDSTAVGGTVAVALYSLNFTNIVATVSGYTATVPFPNPADYGFLIHPTYLKEDKTNTVRGVFPGVYWVLQKPNYAHLTVLDNVAGYPEKKFLFVTFEGSINTGDAASYALDITGPWAY